MKQAIFILICSVILCGCGNSEMSHFSVDIILKKELSNVGENDPLPSYITRIVSPIESKDTFYIPDVTIIRLDLPKEQPLKIEVPSITENSIKKSLGTYDYDNLKDDYNENLPKMLCGKYLTMKGTETPDTKSIQSSGATVFSIEAFQQNAVDSIINIYGKTMKENATVSKIIIVINESSELINLNEGSEPTQVSSNNDCSSLPNEEQLRQELLKIIDTKKTTAERQQIAKNVWKENFYTECYVDNYMDKNDKNPEYWGPKNGVKYLTEHLVTFPSIIDIRIISVERDKETQKVSGLKVCEIYNGSKFNN